jgi:hypothetical protein
MPIGICTPKAAANKHNRKREGQTRGDQRDSDLVDLLFCLRRYQIDQLEIQRTHWSYALRVCPSER